MVNKQFEFKSDLNYFRIILYFLGTIFIFYGIFLKNRGLYFDLSNIFQLKNLVFIMLIYLLLHYINMVLWGIFGKLNILIERDKLIVKKEILGFGIKKTYYKNKIENLRYEEGVESNTGLGFLGVKFWDTNDFMLVFNYGKKEIYIGDKIKNFTPIEIIDEIRKSEKT